MISIGLVMMLAATPASPRHSGAEILRDLRKLSVVGSALYVAAHPDDENTRLLASLANDTQVRAAYLSLTRGEGGQNLIGPEIGPLLGVIRTQELLAARRIDGAEQYFTRARDFGYSKTVDETLSIWNHDQVLSDAVWVIRKLRPDVIITRFPQEGGDTHGHHTASARIALEAFSAAADPKFHPEQLEHVAVWQAKRIVWNAWGREWGDTDPPGKIMTLNSGAYSPLLGLSFGEMAAESRSMHKSQGFGAAPIHGKTIEQFVMLGGTPGASLFDGIDLTWKRVAGSEKVQGLLKKATAEFKVDRPADAVPTLLLALDALSAMPPSPERALKLKDLTSVIVDCSGVFLEATAADFTAVPGGPLEVTASILHRTDVPLTLQSVIVAQKALEGSPDGGVDGPRKAIVTVPATTRLANPYWLDEAPEKGTWTVVDQLKMGVPELPAELNATFSLIASGRPLSVTRPVSYKWTDPTVGERFRSVEIVPPVLVKASANVMLFDSASPKSLNVTVKSTIDAQTGQVSLEVPEGWSFSPASAAFTLDKKGQEAVVTFTVKPGAVTATAQSLKVVARIGSAAYSRGLTRIDYAHIPIQTVLPPASVKLVRLEVSRGKTTRIGYLPGAGDDVAEALKQVGYEVTMLDDEAVRTKPLAGFDAIVVGIRAYNVNPRMPSLYQSLMKYVSDGGTLVVQYNTKNWLSNVPAQMGPYPFEVSQDRVTDETAAVTFELPKHRVLTAPNALGPADFEGWVQERGLYFAGSFDAKYETPLSMHDSGEPARKGGLLVAKHGKGTFIYTGLAFFRQLPAGVPGAYRLIANLLAHGS